VQQWPQPLPPRPPRMSAHEAILGFLGSRPLHHIYQSSDAAADALVTKLDREGYAIAPQNARDLTPAELDVMLHLLSQVTPENAAQAAAFHAGGAKLYAQMLRLGGPKETSPS
jgi:hypothetical protein